MKLARSRKQLLVPIGGLGPCPGRIRCRSGSTTPLHGRMRRIPRGFYVNRTFTGAFGRSLTLRDDDYDDDDDDDDDDEKYEIYYGKVRNRYAWYTSHACMLCFVE